MPSKRIRIVIQSAIWLLLVWFVVRSLDNLPSHDDIALFVQDAGTLRALIAFAGFFLAALLLRALRFGYLVRRATPIGWGKILRAFPWLFMIGSVTPFRLGDVARADWVRRHNGKAAHTIGLWLGERATDLLCLAVFGMLAVALTPGAQDYRTVLIVLTVVLVGLYGMLSVAPLLFRRLKWTTAQGVLSGLSYMQAVGPHLCILMFTAVIWITMGSAFWSGLTLALGAPVPVSMALLCMTFVNLAALISAAPGNVGSFHAAAILALGFYGIPAETALLVASVLHLAGFGVTLAAGAVSWGLNLLIK